MNGRLALAAAAASLLVLVGCAPGDGPRRIRDRDIERAIPSRIVAAELALARAAQEQGQWTAFADHAADEAVLFGPQPVEARAWLRGRPNPAQSVQWRPHRIVMSCDGRLAASTGVAVGPDDSRSRYLTLWRRQSDREYRWVLHIGAPTGGAAVILDAVEPAIEPEFITSQVADCSTLPAADPEAEAAERSGQSADETLRWAVTARADGSHSVLTRYWDGAAWRDAFDGE